MLNLYKAKGNDHQPHFVIAWDMEGAVRAWKDKYGGEPEGLEFVTCYVILSKDMEAKLYA